MKKFAIGCGAVLVILTIVGGFGAWYAYRKASGMYADAKAKIETTVAGFTELGKVPDIERQVRNTTPFSAPASGEITADQLAKYLKVQAQVRQRLGERFTVLNEKHKALIDRLNTQHQSAIDLPEIIDTYKDLAVLYVQGKQAQADALNAQGLSLLEYRWVQMQAAAAIGMPVMTMDVAKTIENFKEGRSIDQSERPVTLPAGPSGPEANKTLVTPHQKEIENNAALAFFGL
jgi:hypothetical protein